MKAYLGSLFSFFVGTGIGSFFMFDNLEQGYFWALGGVTYFIIHVLLWRKV